MNLSESQFGAGELPKGWITTNLGATTLVVLGQSPPSSTYNELREGLPFYQGKAEFGQIYPTPSKWCSEPKKIAEKGDVLISVRAPVGPTNLCPAKSCIGRGLAAIRPLCDMQSLFIFYLMRSFEKILSTSGTGTTFNAITGDQLKSIYMPLPPLLEQKRIIAKIEELFTRLDKGVEALEKIKKELKRYRQSVLKSAFEGRLTEQWRKENKDKIEPANKLLERISKERTCLPKGAGKGKAKKLPPLDKSNLPELPGGWEWARLEAIANIASGQTPKGLPDISSQGQIPFYKVGDMNRSGNEVYMKEAEIYLDTEQIAQLRLHIREKDTVIFPKRGGAIKTNKKRILTLPSAYDLNTMGVLLYLMPNKFFYYWISSIDLFSLSDGSNVPQINHKDIEPLSIPVPPIQEQYVIIAEIERHFSIADEVGQVVDKALKQSQRLRQSILKRAFEGKLVPQDPDDEPAEKLLERIKIEKDKRNRKIFLYPENWLKPESRNDKSDFFKDLENESTERLGERIKTTKKKPTNKNKKERKVNRRR